MSSINTNLAALNVANTLNSHYGNLATSINRLSTGLRINSAADDAAGLAIRELMRSDIAVLKQGQRNANDAISMLQVADAALGIIDEKLIRMKELAEQAATGTYDSTQRLMIHSEFQAMASEIDRIARATDFNGIKLLDGSLSAAHNGKGLKATGAMKIHFGTGNDSAEDYYYVDIADCTTKGLGLWQPKTVKPQAPVEENPGAPPVTAMEYGKFSLSANGMTLNDYMNADGSVNYAGNLVRESGQRIQWQDVLNLGEGWFSSARIRQSSLNPNNVVIDNCPIIRIPAGTTDVVINMFGCDQCQPPTYGDNDIQVFTLDGKHLVGTPLTDAAFTESLYRDSGESASVARPMLDEIKLSGKVTVVQPEDLSILNTGPDVYDSTTLKFSTYNGMTFGYTGDIERQDSVPENKALEDGPDYEVLTIDVVTEDLIIAMPGSAGLSVKAYHGKLDVVPTSAPVRDPVTPPGTADPVAEDNMEPLSIYTQERAQKALVSIDNAIAVKDGIRAHLGALQNRLENTVSNLSIQAVNLQTAESRISDADIAIEMTEFVRNQVLTQTAVAMLGQANSYPRMLMSLIGP